MLNATRRASFREPEPLAPGEIYELDIPLDCTAWMFARGHRIRLSIASADWPNVWPTPYAATNHVYRGPAHPSRLVLPAVPPQGSASPPQFLPSRRSVSPPFEALDPPVWRVSRDQLTGRTALDLQLGGTWRVGDTAIVERKASSRFDTDPYDPSDAGARAQHIFRIVRPNHVTEARADVAVQATTTHFHITIDLVVEVNGALHFTKRWVESVTRQLL
jgi:hypothetical protein